MVENLSVGVEKFIFHWAAGFAIKTVKIDDL